MIEIVTSILILVAIFAAVACFVRTSAQARKFTAMMPALVVMFGTGIHAPTFAAKPVVGVVVPEIAFSGYKCVDRYGNDTGSTECLNSIAQGFAKMLETAIVKTNKMTVIERAQLDPVIAEQGIGAIGLTDRGGAIGGITGVNYLVNGAITKYGAREEQSGIAGSVSGLFGGGRGQQALKKGFLSNQITAEMAVDLKVVDVSTGEIIIAETIDAAAKSGKAFSVGGISQSESSADPIADVQRGVARKIAALVVLQRFPIRIVSVKGGVSVLNYNNSVLSAGECLTVFSLGEEFVDPDTGETLGAEEIEMGRIRIQEATSRFSKAISIGEFVPEKGMIARKIDCPT